MPKDKSDFMKGSQSALNLLHSLYTGTVQSMYAYSHGQIQEGNQIALKNAVIAERLTTRYRALPTLYGPLSIKKEVARIVAEENPVEIGYTDEGWFSVRLPHLLPRKEREKKGEIGSNEYLRGILPPALNSFFKDNYPLRLNDCAIIFRHIYDRNRPERKKRDHDNIEVNFVIDAVAHHVMVDDGALECRHHYCSAAGTDERTEVYVVPEADFVKWYLAEKTFPDEGVKLHVQTTFWPEKVVPKQG